MYRHATADLVCVALSCVQPAAMYQQMRVTAEKATSYNFFDGYGLINGAKLLVSVKS
jgi:hypothetical protein